MEELIALALLEANSRSGQYANDRLGLFLPLVIEALQNFVGVEFSAIDIQASIRRRFDMELPIHVISALLNRCRKKGYLKREKQKYSRTGELLPYFDAVERKQEIAEEHRKLVQAMVEYADKNGVGKFTPMIMSRLLSKYLDNNFRSLSVRSLPFDGKDSSEFDDFNWISAFLLEEKDTHPEFVQTVVSLVRGRVVYDAAFLPGFSEGEQRLKGLIVYLDSPLICRGLGYVSKEESIFVKEAIRALEDAGVICRVLDCTIREIESVMDTVYLHWGSPSVNEPPDSYVYCMPMQGFNRDDALLVSANAESVIKEELGLSVVPTPPRKEEYVSDEKALAKRLKKRDGTLDDERIWHDVNCVAAVLATRKGKYANKIQNSQALFVSLSKLTIRNVNLWWQHDEGRTDIAPIFSLTDLANLAWLYGGANSDSFSKEALMASCAAAMVPSEEVWNVWSTKLSKWVDCGKLTSEEAKDRLFSLDARAVVREYGEKLIDDNNDEVFEVVLSEIDKRVADKVYQKELKRHESEEKALVKQINELHEAVAESTKRDEEKSSLQRNRIERLVNAITNIIRFTLFLLGLGLILLVISDSSNTSSDYIQCVLSILSFFGAILVKSNKVKDSFTSFIYNWLRL